MLKFDESMYPTIEGPKGEQHLVFHYLDIPNSIDFFSIKMKSVYGAPFKSPKLPDDGLYMGCDSQGNVIAYIDMFGLMYHSKTTRGEAIMQYLENVNMIPFMYVGFANYKRMFTGVEDISHEFFNPRNMAFISMIQREEDRRINELAKKGAFKNLIEVYAYKKYVKNVISRKIKRFVREERQSYKDRYKQSRVIDYTSNKEI